MSLYTRGNARRSLIDAVIFRAIAQLSTAVSYVVMVRGMSKAEFGVFNLLYAFIPVVSTVASLGLEQTLRRFQPEYLRTGKLPAANWLFRFVSKARFGSNVLMLALILLAWNFVAPLFKLGEYRDEFAFFCLLILLYFQVTILQLSFASHMMQRYAVGSVALMSVVKLVAYSAFVLFDKLTLMKALGSDLISFVLAFAVMTWLHRRHCQPQAGEHRDFTLDKAERKRLFRYGAYNNFNDAGSLLLSNKSDNFYIAAFINPLAVGVYSFYTRLSEMIGSLLPVKMFESVVQPLFFATPRGEARERIPRYFSLLLNLNLVLQWPILAFAAAYHVEIVQVVFGGKYVEDSWLLPVILAFNTINVISVPVTMVAQYEEKARAILVSKVFAIYNVLALVVLVPWIGLYGAAIASGSAGACKNIFIWWHARDLAVWLNLRAAALTGVLLWGGVVLLCEALKHALGVPPLLQLALGAIVCGGACLLHLRSPAISGSDRSILTSVLRGRETKLLKYLGLMGPVAGRG
jgi:O-antigen/teichoic acid export membrane protein